MKQQLLSFIICAVFFSLASCGNNGGDDYNEVPTGPVSPVVMNLDSVPYTNLSHYKFFEGDIKNQQPVPGVLPYDLNSSLFTDYALKKRFVWMPIGTKATYTGDGQVLNFPTGTVLIKTFYYDNAYPSHGTDLVETRIMIKKGDGWIFANYIWNATMTDAVLNTNAVARPVSWYEDDYLRQVNYKIPSQAQCATCHTLNDVHMPIGPKPQNLNKIYAYTDGARNQLAKWVEQGYLTSIPSGITSIVNWEDTTQSLELRARSYLDINCAHCHSDGTYCSYTPMNLAFNKSNIPANLGICIEPSDYVSGEQEYIIAAGNAEGSLLPYRMKTTIQAEMMPLLGRTVSHREGVALIEEWINAMTTPCP